MPDVFFPADGRSSDSWQLSLLDNEKIIGVADRMCRYVERPEFYAFQSTKSFDVIVRRILPQCRAAVRYQRYEGKVWLLDNLAVGT